MNQVPEEAKLVCDGCANEEEYYPAVLLLFADNITSPNTFWWFHFPKHENDVPPIRCNAGKLFEYWLKEHIADE